MRPVPSVTVAPPANGATPVARASLALAPEPAGEAENILCRRQFLQLASGVALTAFVVPALAGCEVGELSGPVGPTSFTFDLSQAPYMPLSTVGNVVAVDSGQKRVLMMRTSVAEIVALDRICTHQACDLSPAVSGRWASATLQMTCRCHGARFDCKTGNVLEGPAPTALRKYPVTFDATMGKGSVTFT